MIDFYIIWLLCTIYGSMNGWITSLCHIDDIAIFFASVDANIIIYNAVSWKVFKTHFDIMSWEYG